MKTRIEELIDLIKSSNHEISMQLSALNADIDSYNEIMRLHNDVIQYSLELKALNGKIS